MSRLKYTCHSKRNFQRYKKKKNNKKRIFNLTQRNVNTKENRLFFFGKL